jgi:hypothetical protein
MFWKFPAEELKLIKEIIFVDELYVGSRLRANMAMVSD